MAELIRRCGTVSFALGRPALPYSTLSASPRAFISLPSPQWPPKQSVVPLGGHGELDCFLGPCRQATTAMAPCLLPVKGRRATQRDGVRGEIRSNPYPSSGLQSFSILHLISISSCSIFHPTPSRSDHPSRSQRHASLTLSILCFMPFSLRELSFAR